MLRTQVGLRRTGLRRLERLDPAIRRRCAPIRNPSPSSITRRAWATPTLRVTRLFPDPFARGSLASAFHSIADIRVSIGTNGAVSRSLEARFAHQLSCGGPLHHWLFGQWSPSPSALLTGRKNI